MAVGGTEVMGWWKGSEGREVLRRSPPGVRPHHVRAGVLGAGVLGDGVQMTPNLPTLSYLSQGVSTGHHP